MGFYKTESCKPPYPSSHNSSSCFPLGSPSPTVQSQTDCSSCVCLDWAQEELNNCSPSSFQLCAMGLLPLPPPKTPASTCNQKFSDHERILILQLFKFFDLLSQKQYPLLTQCCLYFTDSDQGPEVFQLSAVLRHTDAPHGVSLFT